MKRKKPRNNKQRFKKIVNWLHLWPSLISGIFILLICLTGTILVYADEIIDFSAGDAQYVEEIGEKRISSHQIIENINEAYPGYIISEFVFFKDPKRSLRLRCYHAEDIDLCMIYMNPYTGEIIKKDNTIFVFFAIAHIHASFLAGPVGTWIVIISTMVFLLGCISGLYLWWPKKWNKTARKRNFTIKWKAKFRRLNHDLHNVLGFYILIPSIVLALTGLMISFPNFMDYTIHATGKELEPMLEVLPAMDSTKVSKNLVPFAYEILENEYPNKNEVSIWNFDYQKLGAYVFTSGKVGLKSIENADVTIYDRYTGERIFLEEGYLKNEWTRNFIWQLHMGQWWGQFGKLITFIAGLIATSLAVTGFFIWWHKRKKKPSKKV